MTKSSPYQCSEAAPCLHTDCRIYDPDFIIANQGTPADNLKKGTKKELMEEVIKDNRRAFNTNIENKVEKVVAIWTTNMEHYSDVFTGSNDTQKDESEILP